MKKYFTGDDVGCWIDGAFGEEHRRGKLSSMMFEIGEQALSIELEGPMPDDAGDEMDALGKLQENTADGLTWVMDAGDLILTDEDVRFF